MGGGRTEVKGVERRLEVELLEGLSSLRAPSLHGVNVECERERRYFVPRTALDDVVNLRRLDSVIVTQRYLSLESGSLVVALLSAFGVSNVKPNHVVTQARLRETRPHRERHVTRELAVKLKHRECDPIERLEITVPLDRVSFERLVPLVNGWTIVKQRYSLPCEIGSGRTHTFEIDSPLGVTRSGQMVKPPGECFAIIDLELDHRTTMRRGGLARPEHPLLDVCVDISADMHDRAELRKPLSWRRLGEKGFDKRARHAIEGLHAAFRSGMR